MCSMSLLWSLLSSTSPKFPQRSCLSLSQSMKFYFWMPAQGLRLLRSIYFFESDCFFHLIFKISLLHTLLCFTPSIHQNLLILLGTLVIIIIEYCGWRLLYIQGSCLSKAHFYLTFPSRFSLLTDSSLAIGRLPLINSWYKKLPTRQLYKFTLTYLVRSPKPSHGSRNLYKKDLSICFELDKITFKREKITDM